MDYNSYPWTYEVVGIREDGSRESFTTEDYKHAKNEYDIANEETIFKTVLLLQSRLGVVKGIQGL